jgi:hypothetical protein
MWAVIVRWSRSRWINWTTLRSTRKGAIAEYCAAWTKPPYQDWSHWKARGYTCERVLVRLAPSLTDSLGVVD